MSRYPGRMEYVWTPSHLALSFSFSRKVAAVRWRDSRGESLGKETRIRSRGLKFAERRRWRIRDFGLDVGRGVGFIV